MKRFNFHEWIACELIQSLKFLNYFSGSSQIVRKAYFVKHLFALHSRCFSEFCHYAPQLRYKNLYNTDIHCQKEWLTKLSAGIFQEVPS